MKKLTLMTVTALAIMIFGVASASATFIPFDGQVPNGPSTFGAAGPAQTWTILGATFTGGVILTGTTNLPADETSVYGTCAPALCGTGLLNPLTVSFGAPIHNFFVYVYNGQTYDETFTISDNAGNTETVTLVPNLSSGVALVSFPAAGSIVTITTADPNWDFFIDNITFNANAPQNTPEPSTMVLLGSGLLGLASRLRRRA